MNRMQEAANGARAYTLKSEEIVNLVAAACRQHGLATIQADNPEKPVQVISLLHTPKPDEVPTPGAFEVCFRKSASAVDEKAFDPYTHYGVPRGTLFPLDLSSTVIYVFYGQKPDLLSVIERVNRALAGGKATSVFGRKKLHVGTSAHYLDHDTKDLARVLFLLYDTRYVKQCEVAMSNLLRQEIVRASDPEGAIEMFVGWGLSPVTMETFQSEGVLNMLRRFSKQPKNGASTCTVHVSLFG